MELTRRDVILSAIAVFIAWGYVTHWLPSFRYLPYAFVAGFLVAVVLSLGFVILRVRNRQQADYRELYGPSHVAFVTPRAWKIETNAWRARTKYHPKPVYPPSVEVSKSIDRLLGLLLRDFIVVWYGHISKRPEFTNEVDKAIRVALVSILDRLLNLDLVGLVVARIIPIITMHMKDFYDAERAIRGKKLTRNITESEGLDLAIANKFRNGNLHKAASLSFANSAMVEQQYLRGIVSRLLPKVLPPDMLTSPAVNVLIQEIVGCAVLAPALKLAADPDTWHQILETYGRTILQERKNVRKLRAALDQHAPQSPKTTKNVLFPKLHPDDNERKFEKFIRAIRKCNTLSDARRFRSEIAIQLRKESTIDNQDALYLRRLETGKKLLDQRIAQLGQAGSSKRSMAHVVEQQRNKSSQYDVATLKDILYNSAGLSYFMEFMDRQHLMPLVQFWVVVDGIRNPLEDDNDIGNESHAASWTVSDRNDVAQISEAYLSKPEIRASPMAQEIVKTFLRAGRKATNAQYHAARQEILKAQNNVYDELIASHFVGFKKSDLWYKFLAAEDAIVSPVSKIVHSDIQENLPIAPPGRPQKLSRAGSGVLNGKAPDLRRAVASSSDLLSGRNSDDLERNTRGSLDSAGSSARAPLFDDDMEGDPMAGSTASIESDQDTNGPVVQDPRVVDAMQVALNDIMENQPDKDALFVDASVRGPLDEDSLRGSMDQVRRSSVTTRKDREKPSIASLGLIDAAGRRGVFDDDLFGEENKFAEDDKEDDSEGKNAEDEIHEAAPGDLGLAEAIDALTLDIEKLVTQESIVDSLTKKAELTNNAAELRILRKSKTSLQREISRKELQRQQYIIQESDNSLFGKAHVHIKSIMVGTEEDGREFAMYIVEVTRQAGEQMSGAVWAVARRYSEFHELNKNLRALYPQIKSLEFPRRQVPMLKLQKDFLEKRRLLLEKYLQALLQNRAICRSRELRAFLSQQSLPSTNAESTQGDSKDIVSRIYSSVTDGMEEFLGNIPVLDQLSIAGQNLITAATTQLQMSEPITLNQSHPPNDELRASAEAEAELAAFDMKELEPFVKPICDLFLETFELNKENNWLRGRAVVLVLHQLLGGTVERKVRDNARSILSDEGATRLLNMAMELLWPGGGPRIQKTVRTPLEKDQSQKQAAVVLGSLIPDLVGSVVGRTNAQGAARRILAMLNNERLK